MIDERTRNSLLRKGRRDTLFFDDLVREVWCQCKVTGRKSESWEEWCDDPLNSEKGHGMAADFGNYHYATPRMILTRKELDAVQEFIQTHTFRTVIEGRIQIAADLLDDWQSKALDVLWDRTDVPNY